MIQLTRLNKKPMILNSDLIEFIENTPDTVITLITGGKIVVLESTEDILNLVVAFRRRLLPASFATLPPTLILSRNSERSDPAE
ncbi:MAG: flagellar FlbD family protein [Terriglobia bacterium]